MTERNDTSNTSRDRATTGNGAWPNPNTATPLPAPNGGVTGHSGLADVQWGDVTRMTEIVRQIQQAPAMDRRGKDTGTRRS